MRFESIRKETVVLNPLQKMKRRVIPSEIRKDPLTGRTARICHFMKLQWEKPDLEAIAAGTRKTCPFCPEHVLEKTPLFPEEILPEGRLIADDRVLFPNLAPYDSISCVAVMGAAHYVPMTGLTPEMIAGAFRLAIRFFERLDAVHHPESVYQMINWNYMPPAGSSIIHPHLQVFASSSAPNLMRMELEAAKAYKERTGTGFWEDLTAAEAASGERWLGKIGAVSWLGAYAPLGVAGDIIGVFDHAVTLRELTDADLLDMGEGLHRLMVGYDRMGIYSFNMNFFPGAAGDDFTRLHLVFSPRAFFNQALGTPDVGAGQKLFNETVCMAYPEEINARLKSDFEGN